MLFALVPQLALLIVFIIYVGSGPVNFAVGYFRSKEPITKVQSEDGLSG